MRRRCLLLLATAVSAGITGPLAPHAVAGASPSEHACATAFDSPANAAVRARIARASVLRAEIFATTIPSCLVKFQLPAQQVLTAQAAWRAGGGALAWTVSSNPHGLVAGANARWRSGQLTATGPDADRVYDSSPGPTASSCMDAWNLAPPTLPRGVAGPDPVVVDALNGGMTFGSGGQPPIAGDACTIWIVRSPTDVLLIAGAWRAGHRGSWRPAVHTDGLLGGTTPNATLGRDGTLTARAATPIQPHPKVTTVPNVSHTIGATGWVGGFHLGESVQQAIARFGPPSTELPGQFECTLGWPGLRLSVVFGPARGRNAPTTPCTSGSATGFVAGRSWATTRGLGVGDPDSAIALRYPGAGHSTSAGVATWYLSPRHASNAAITLTAQATLGTITSITVSASAPAVYGISG